MIFLDTFKCSFLPRINKRLIKLFGIKLESIDFQKLLAARLAASGRERFFFLQIGAYDGISDDQITKFVSEYQIAGILLEPQPDVFLKLRKNYANQPQLVLLNAAIAQEGGEVDFFTVENNSEDLPEWVKQTASFNKENILKLEQGIPEHGIPAVPRIAESIKSIRVKAVDFKTVLNLVPENALVELLQIDAEGFDSEVIKLFPFEQIKPSVVRYEHMHLRKADKKLADSILRKHGYVLYEEKSDTIAFISARIGG